MRTKTSGAAVFRDKSQQACELAMPPGQPPCSLHPARESVTTGGSLTSFVSSCTTWFLSLNLSCRYVGVTRSITPSLRLHMARKPKECYAVKVGSRGSANAVVAQL